MSQTPLPPGGFNSRKPPPEGDGTEAPKKKRYWWRFLLAGVIIVSVCAAATSSATILYIDSIVHEFETPKQQETAEEVEEVIQKVPGGAPQTILVIGSDSRPEMDEKYGRSDTTILLRLDGGKNLISVMSIPRDLKVNIPGIAVPEKFNGAYSFGGPKLTIKVVKELTGLQINHIVNIGFLGFVRAVDAIGCVYTDVDRRYYHSNVGVPEEEQYSEINIQPGYQKLCGVKALEYVRYRHTDTDIVRSARQQSFLSQVRRQVNPTDLITDNHNLIGILAHYTSTDIDEGTELIQLLNLLYELRGAEVQQIHFPAELGPSFVYSNEDEIHHAVKEFLGEAGYQTQKSEDEAKKKKAEKKRKAEKRKERAKAKKAAKKKGKKGAKPKLKRTPPGGDELVPAAEAGEAMGEKAARHVGGGFPVFYPTRLPEGAAYVETNPYEHVVNPRVYHLKDKDKERHAAYRMVGVFGPEYELHYFGVQGIAGWEDPPILDDPTEEKTVNGRDYSIYTDSGQIKLVAWHRGENTYWISNSLEQALTNEQMMGIAESSHVIEPTPAKGKAKHTGG
jgi:polyisoprenyl-teichoic acid--peptidoglycan teichoic acid transferase